MNVGSRITELRQEKGISVNKLANLSGVSQSYLRDVELGNKQPTVEYLDYICEGLGITLKEFFDDNDKSGLEKAMLKLTPEQKYKLISFLESLGTLE
ncbi:MAG: helix-turn-helix domain-containing protein [Acutalibacteraceae bacterium]